jgi:hypothetical protein
MKTGQKKIGDDNHVLAWCPKCRQYWRLDSYAIVPPAAVPGSVRPRWRLLCMDCLTSALRRLNRRATKRRKGHA